MTLTKGAGAEQGNNEDRAGDLVTMTGNRSRIVILFIALTALSATACGTADKTASPATGPDGKASSTPASSTPASASKDGKTISLTLTRGTLEGKVTGAVTRDLKLLEVSPSMGTPGELESGETELGPGFNFYNFGQPDKLILKLPAGPVGTDLTSSDLEKPVRANISLTEGFFDTGDGGTCKAKLSTISATELGGTIDCRLKGVSTSGWVNLTASFELRS